MSEDVICEYSSKGTKVFGVKIVIVLLFLFTFLLQFTLVKTRLKMNFSADREYDRPRGPRSLKKITKFMATKLLISRTAEHH